jgi:peptide/nickel transport system substrate-binding protein
MRRYRYAAPLLACLLAGIARPTLARADGNLTIAMPADQEPASIDGQIDPYQLTWLLDSFVTDPLVVLDPSGHYVPGLATSWDVSPDARIWTFHLRDGVTFQDGTRFDAAAIKTNLERIADPKTASAQLKNDLGPYTSVEVVDPLTVRITYATPWVTLLEAIRRAPFWSPAALAKYSLADFQQHLVGTGPFRLGAWQRNDRIIFTRWDGYRGWNPVQTAKGPVSLSSLTIRFIGEAAVLGRMVETGDADIAYMLPQDAIEDYKGKPAYSFIIRDQSGTGLQMVMNLRHPPLNDLRVRQALLYANDENLVNDVVYDGNYAKSEGPLSNNHPCHWSGAGGVYPPDPARAAALLDQAGWKLVPGQPIRQAVGVPGVTDGTPLRLRWTVLHHKEIGEAVQQQFRKIGVDLRVEVVPGPVQIDRVGRRDFDLIYERQRSPDPYILDQIWNSRWDQPGGWAWTGFKDPQLDAVLDTLRTEPSFAKRCDAAKTAQQMILQNALQLSTLSDPVFVAFRTARVSGFDMGSEGNWFFVNNVKVTQ